MPVEAVLVTQPAIDFSTLLALAHEALGYNIAGNADASYRKLSDAEKFLSCLAAIKEEDAVNTNALTPNLLSHVSFSVLIVAEDRDLMEILERTSGMSFVQSETTIAGIHLAILTGTLAQWKMAVAAGTAEATPPTVRTCYSKILLLFDRAGLTAVWGDFDRRPAPDRSGFLLEYQ